MAITSIPTLSDISRTPKIMANEVDKFNSLINKYTTLTTSGFQTFTSQSSGVIYNTVANGGETELLSILINAINANSSSPCIFTASHFNSIKSTLEAGVGSEVNADKLDDLHASDFAKLVGGNTFTGLQFLESLKIKVQSPTEGGEIELEKPTSSTLSGNIKFDIIDDKIRFFENGGAFRGAYIPLANLLGAVDSELLTSSTTTYQKSAIEVGSVSVRTLLISGIYQSANLIDLPPNLTSQRVYVEVIRYNDLYVMQKVYSFDLVPRGSWTIKKENGVWGEWQQEIITTSSTKQFVGISTQTLTDNGRYRVVNITNPPLGYSAINDFYLDVQRIEYNQNYCKQIMTEIQTNRTFTQTQANNIWSGWKEIFTEESYGFPIEKSSNFNINTVRQSSVIYVTAGVVITIGSQADNVNIPIGNQYTVISYTGFPVSFAVTGDSTLDSKNGKRTLDGTLSSATLIRITPSAWSLIGDLKA